ncbi:P-loop containing nucleoside triphosphate hydrolase protein [Mycena olivaceomarginata]|nr:P-loop containing nucleoside triphosphate hydrolase protein [Mycena olivaceomarginata]
MLDNIGRFTETLHRIYTFLQAQGGNKIKHFFRQSEINTLHKACRAGLEDALKVFRVDTGLPSLESVAEMRKRMQSMHEELLEAVEVFSDGTASDRYSVAGSRSRSSISISMLPGQPKIFHGRESEFADILSSLTKGPARIAILGPGGIGKTSLAEAVLHHTHISARYEYRLFVATDSVGTGNELVALIGSHLGLKPGYNLKNSVVQFLTTMSSCLLVLDNLDTLWEPPQTRGEIEELLSLLTEITHLTLIITMRGAERPAKVRWTRPCLEPLKPLSYDSARQTFFDIADDYHYTVYPGFKNWCKGLKK